MILSMLHSNKPANCNQIDFQARISGNHTMIDNPLAIVHSPRTLFMWYHICHNTHFCALDVMEDISDDVVQDKGITNEQDFFQDSDSCDLIKDGVKKEPRKKLSLTSLPTPNDVTTPKTTLKVRRLFPCLIKTRQSRYITGIVATSSLGSFLWGYNFSVVAGAMLLIDDHFNLSVLWHEAIVSLIVGGATVGAAVAGTLNDKFGRWKVMMMSAILHVVATVVMAFAFSEVFLVIGRTIAGLAIGIICYILQPDLNFDPF